MYSHERSFRINIGLKSSQTIFIFKFLILVDSTKGLILKLSKFICVYFPFDVTKQFFTRSTKYFTILLFMCISNSEECKIIFLPLSYYFTNSFPLLFFNEKNIKWDVCTSHMFYSKNVIFHEYHAQFIHSHSHKKA